ncbi:VPLPA-CTERM sorting domain-containing protein [Methylomonas rhizoryzae]|uniref:VPLPA-CTERM sorting domain-containing protein n=1 Tax=Methylomonas rhizoryzae TaxID=2608981 RepID=UPI001232EDF8|nr:VPLPA-CTERM sorting domain-containing protein [Methylomonas rhizoryzae]
MTNTTLAKAISTLIAGTALVCTSGSAAASTTMYNTFTTTAKSATDGWTRIADSNGDGYGTGPESKGNSGLILPWAGTTGNKLPFDYTGSSHLNWAVQLSGEGDTAQISGADSMARYGFDAEIDTGGGAWRDTGLDGNGNPTATGPTGWKHQTDIGLISSDVTQWVTINLTALSQLQSPTYSQFGVTVFEGMDTNTGDYVHHGSWNNASKPYTLDNPFGTTGLTNIGYSDNVDAVAGFTFLAQAGQIYTIYLGGVDFSRWNAGVDNYRMDITTALTAPVPLPAAAWLFGSAFAGLLGFSGRKKARLSA